MKAEFNKADAPSPRDSMYSELLMIKERQEIPINPRMITQEFRFAAWLKLKNSQNLPAMLLMEHKDFRGEMWHIIDTASVVNTNGTLLLSGSVEIPERRIHQIKLYVCHPSDQLLVDVDEIRFNDELAHRDFLSQYQVA